VNVEQVASRMSNRRLFKKIDSTLRGNIGDEINALLTATGTKKAILCSAAPDIGRTVQHGLLLVNGAPLHQTAFANDPHWPAETAKISDLIRGAASSHIGLGVVRDDVHVLVDAVQHAPANLVTVDATNHDDLVRIAQAAIVGGFLPCGSRGLAAAWIHSLSGYKPDAVQPDAYQLYQACRQAPLVVSGSRHPVAEKQLALLTDSLDAATFIVHPDVDLASYSQEISEALLHRTVVIVRTHIERLTDPQLIYTSNVILRELIKHLCSVLLPAGLVLIGGETASYVVQELGLDGIQILGELESGVPVGLMLGGSAPLLPVITKAGGVGTDTTLISVVERFRREQ
jgi:D-threonate/D-erythronate kinase